jgi:hypothetical protein
MKYRVLRYFEDDENDQTLIGHFETKRLADNAIRDDIYEKTKYKTIGVGAMKYKIDPVETIMTQAEIDELFKQERLNRLKEQQ